MSKNNFFFQNTADYSGHIFLSGFCFMGKNSKRDRANNYIIMKRGNIINFFNIDLRYFWEETTQKQFLESFL